MAVFYFLKIIWHSENRKTKAKLNFIKFNKIPS